VEAISFDKAALDGISLRRAAVGGLLLIPIISLGLIDNVPLTVSCEVLQSITEVTIGSKESANHFIFYLISSQNDDYYHV
jgi:hypothetical protein